IAGQEGRITHWPETYSYDGKPRGERYIVNSRDIQNAHFNTLQRAKDFIKERWNETGNQAPGRGRTDIYRSSHWDEPNVLAHIRFDDRTGPNGERILHVAEVQSDWHQAGRKRGYATEVAKAAKARADALVEERERFVSEHPLLRGSPTYEADRAHYEAL